MLTLAFFFLNVLLSATFLHADEQSGLEPVTLQLKWKHQFQFAGYYAAIEKGYYRDAGLDVTLKEAEPARDPVSQVLKGHADFGVGTSELILWRSKGKPLVVLATIYQHSPLVLLSKADGQVQDLQSLYDKPIMIEPQSAELFAYFKDEGIDPSKLHIVRHSFDVKDIISGKVAAMSAYSTDEPYVLNKAGIHTLAFTPRAGGIDFYGDNLFTTEAMIQRHPQRVRAFLEASLKGWDYAMKHPEEMVDLILGKYNTQGKTREHLLYEAEHTMMLIHPELIEIGHMNPGRWKNIADTYAEFGMIPQDFSLDGFLYDINPAPVYTRLYWILGIFGIVTLAALLWLVPVLRFNHSLRNEITERHRVESLLRESELQYRMLTEKVPFPVAITDMETHQLLFANQQATDMMQVKYDEAVGRHPVDFYVNPADREFLIKEVRGGKLVTDFEVSLRTQQGRIIWVLIAAALVEFSGRKGMVVAFQDITQRRNMRQELQRAKDAAESANAAKSGYLAVMSHELRSPITGIIGLSNLMKEESVSTEQKENLDLIASTGEGLLKLISDLLDHSKLEAGRVELDIERVETEIFMRDLYRLFKAPAQAKNIELHLRISSEVPKFILTDSLRLHQILGNLLSNAIKFTDEGSVEIDISASPVALDNSGLWRLHCQIRDSGIGIAPEHVDRLFKAYSQVAASTSRRYGGTGLGLAISSQLAELMGGKMSVESFPGKGSTFHLEILTKEDLQKS